MKFKTTLKNILFKVIVNYIKIMLYHFNLLLRFDTFSSLSTIAQSHGASPGGNKTNGARILTWSGASGLASRSLKSLRSSRTSEGV